METLNLMHLPNEIQRRIYDYLLDSKSIKDSSNSHKPFHPGYNYSTAILRVCKSINALAGKIFTDNHFILVSTTDANLIPALISHLVWFRHEKISHFKEYHLRLHILSKPRTGHTHFLLISLEVAEKFVRVLQLVDVMEKRQYRLNFDVKMAKNVTLPLSVQRHLFEPFLTLRCSRQKCSVRGSVDLELVQEIQNRLTPWIHWTRTKGWEMVPLLDFKLSVANSISLSGRHDAACRYYADFVRFMGLTQVTEFIQQTDDSILKCSFGRLLTLAVINQARSYLLTAREDTPEQRSQYYQQVLTSEEILSGHLYANPQKLCTEEEQAIHGRRTKSKLCSREKHVLGSLSNAPLDPARHFYLAQRSHIYLAMYR